jgi:hypothetical protein
MKMLSEEKVKVLAEKYGWTATYLEGYISGKNARRRGLVPSTFQMIGIDEYCLGYRAGYYAADRKQRVAKEPRR